MTTWLAVADVAQLPPFDRSRTPSAARRGVRRLAEKLEREGKVRRTLRGRNANALEIALDGLPDEARAKYHADLAARSLRVVTRKDEGPSPMLRSWAAATDGQRARAEARAAAVIAFELFLEQWGTRKNRRIAKRRWAREYAIANPEISISVTSVERWMREYNAGGRKPAALVDGNDGSARNGRTSIPPQILEEFKALYWRPAKPKVSTCYQQMKKVARARGWKLPSCDAFRYWVEHHMNRAAASYYREPDKRRENLCPFLQRDYDDPEFRAMQIIQSDHHQIDVAVACGDPLCGVGHYPWITVWIDLRSRKVLAVEVYIEHPNSKRILKLLHRVIVENGLPEFVYADNGMDYVKAVGGWSLKHYEVGRRSARSVQVAGWTPDLVERIAGPFGMQAIFSIEGNPQSKLIERWFSTLENLLYALYDSYRGKLGERSERAEYLRQHPAELPNICDFAVDVQRAIEEYNTRPHRGDGMQGRSPSEVFAATRATPREADPAALSMAFWTEERIGAKVQQQGIKHQKRWYRLSAASQVEYFDRKVNFLFDYSAPDTIAVYDATGRFICVASTRTRAPQTRGPELAAAIAEKQAEWKEIQAYIRQHNPSAAKRLDAIGAGIEEYYALLDREAAVQQPVAAAAGGVVTVVDSHLSLLAATAEDHTDEFLDLALRHTGRDHTDDEADDPVVFAAERERIHASRERERKVREGECLDCPAPAWAGPYCREHHRLSD